MSIRAYFLGAMAALGAVALALALLMMSAQWAGLHRAAVTAAMTRQLQAALMVIDQAGLERAAYRLALIGDDRTVAEAGFRAGTDAAFAVAIPVFEAAPGPAAATRLAAMRAAQAAVARLRARVDATLAGTADDQPGAPDQRIAPAEYWDEQGRAIATLVPMADRLAAGASRQADAAGRLFLDIIRLAGDLRAAAVERAVGIREIAALTGPVTPDMMEAYGAVGGRMDGLWQRIDDSYRRLVDLDGAGTAPVAELGTSLHAAHQAYFQDLAAIYRRLADARLAGMRTDLSNADLFRTNLPGFRAMVRIRDVAARQAIAGAESNRAGARLGLWMTVAAAAVVAAGIALAVQLLRWRVVSPLGVLTGIVLRLAGNDRDLCVPGRARHDEIGRLAQAIETLRRNAEHAAALERERQAMEMQLRQAQKLESLGTLASGIAHEINTPIQFVGDNVRFLGSALDDLQPVLDAAAQLGAAAAAAPALAPLAAALARAQEAADLKFLKDEIPSAVAHSLDGVARVRQIVQAVKEISHPGERGKQPVDINHTVQTTLTVSRAHWKYVADVMTDLAPGLPPVLCRAGEIHQVLINLLVNAAHAIEAKGAGRGRIEIRTACQGAWLELRVVDTGTGIPPELVERVFDPFFTTKPVGKGTGQGLAIAHAIVVRNHGGRIAVESVPGEGAAFTIHLPLAEASASVPAEV